MKKRKKRESDPNAMAWLEFRTCPANCLACNQCGYFWGPGHDKWPGKAASWNTPGNAGGVR